MNETKIESKARLIKGMSVAEKAMSRAYSALQQAVTESGEVPKDVLDALLQYAPNEKALSGLSVPQLHKLAVEFLKSPPFRLIAKEKTMKIEAKQRLTAGPVGHPILTELKGKKLDWYEMSKFLDSHTEVFEKKGTMWKVKKDAGVNIRPIVTALKNAAAGAAEPELSRAFITVEWADKYPIKATVMLNTRVFDKSKPIEDFNKQKQADFAWAMKNATGTGGGKGWYVSSEGSSRPLYGRFDEGPQEGNMFKTDARSASYKKGDKIKVVITSSTYGRVELA
jgi:hypothetical protein